MYAWFKTFFTGLTCDSEGKVSTLRCFAFGGVIVITLFCIIAYFKGIITFDKAIDILKFLLNVVVGLSF